MFQNNILEQFSIEVEKYPKEQRQSAVMACLAIVQREYGYLSPELIQGVGAYLNMPTIAVQEVSTFYNMYNNAAVGRFKLNVCTNLPCQLGASGGGEFALKHICERLNVKPYGTTEDGLFTIQPSECLGACADAPVLLVNDQTMCSYMTSDKINQLLDGLKTL